MSNLFGLPLCILVNDVDEDCRDFGIARPDCCCDVGACTGPFVMNSFDSYVHIAYG